MKPTLDQVVAKLEANRDAIRALGVRRLGVFGSVARGEEGESSDLDFLVEFERKTFDAYMDLKFLLEEIFGRPVDLVLSDALKPRLRDAVLKETIYAPRL
jgi:hypothetical protein